MNPDTSLEGPMNMERGIRMTHGTSLSDMDFGGGIALIQFAFYLFYSYCQYTLSKKRNIEYSWMAWIPVLSIFNLVKIAGLSFWWVLGLCIPLWNIYVIIKTFHGISKNTGHGAWWTVGLIFLYLVMFPVTAFTYNPSGETSKSPSENPA